MGDLGLIPELGRFPGEGKGYPLQYSGLENSLDCIVHGVAKSDMTEQLSPLLLVARVTEASSASQLFTTLDRDPVAAGFGAMEEGLISRGGRNLRLPLQF